MTHPELPDNIDDTFATLMNSMTEIYVEGEHCVASLSPVVDRLVALGVDIVIELSLRAHAMTEADWPEYFTQTNLRLAHAFELMSELQYGDEVLASGRTAAMPVDMKTGEIAPDFQGLSDDVYLRGTLVSIVFGQIPAYDYLPKLIGEIDKSDDLKGGSCFGVSLYLTNVSIEERDGPLEEMPADMVMMLPLNYPALKLGRIIGEDTA